MIMIIGLFCHMNRTLFALTHTALPMGSLCPVALTSASDAPLGPVVLRTSVSLRCARVSLATFFYRQNLH